MNKKITQIVLVGLVVSFIIPQFALASWWNPFTWFNRTVKTEVILVATSTTSIATTSTAAAVTIPTITTPVPTAVPVQPKIASTLPNTIEITPPKPVKLRPATTTALQDCSVIENVMEKDTCYVSISKATKDPDICPKITNLDKRNTCYLVIAVMKKDRSLCELIVDGNDTVMRKACDAIKDPVYSANSPKGIITAEFLKDPTLDNFKLFCNKAKDIEGSQVERTMDDSRESLITKKISYYFDLEDCVNLSDSEDIFYFPLNSDLQVELKRNDPNWFREVKLLYNDKIQALISNSVIKFVTFQKDMFSGVPGDNDEFDSIKSPQELFDYYSSRIDNIEDYLSSSELNSEKKDDIIDRYIETYKEKVKRIPNAVSDMKMLSRTLERN